MLLNGSLCLDGSFSAIYKNPIPTSQIQAMLELRQELGFALMFMEESAMYVSHITPEPERLQAQIATAILPSPPVSPSATSPQRAVANGWASKRSWSTGDSPGNRPPP